MDGGFQMFLDKEHKTTEHFFPGLLTELKGKSFEELESAEENLPSRLMRKYSIGSLLIPKRLGGMEASLEEAIEVHRSIGSFSPSLAVQATMHNFTMIICSRLSGILPNSENLLRSVSQDRLLVASGFAEGQPGASILDSNLIARPVTGGYLLSGCKKPCSMTNNMDVMTAGIAIMHEGMKYTGLAIIRPDCDGISKAPFWTNPALAGSDSHQVTLDDVFIPEDDVMLPDPTDANQAEAVALAEVTGIGYFQALISASYLGVASGLARMVFQGSRGSQTERVQLLTDLESAALSLRGCVHLLEEYPIAEEKLSQILLVRYGIQKSIMRSTNLAMELIGGLAFITSTETSNMFLASRALCFHPINRKQAEQMIDEQLCK
jgi:alkylation response protein AidB-like acyl-CoA dehydrogenase